MAITLKRFTKGIALKGEAVDITDNVEGSIFQNSADLRLKAYIEGAVRQIVTNSQSQVLTNKTIDATSNTISNIQTTNLQSGTLNTSTTLSGATNTQLPSALAVKTYIDDKAAAQNEASEISFTPVGTIAATTVQAMGQELDGDIQGHITDTSDAHDASAISVIATGNLVSTDVQNALQEHQTDIDTINTSLSGHIPASTNVHGIGVGSSVVGTATSQVLTNKTITGADIRTPVRSDVKQDSLPNLVTYALTASNGQIVYATDEKSMYQVVDTELVGIGGAGVVKLTAGENISILDLVYISTGTGNDSGRTAGRVYKVDASNDDRVEVLGFATKAITSGAIGEVQVSGNLKGFTGLTAGKIYYASALTPGAITGTPPSTNGQWVVAVCLTSTASEIVINPVSSASAIYVVDGDISFTIANNQTVVANVNGLLVDGASTRSFILDYSIYRQTDTASSALAQVGQIRGVYNTQSTSWVISDDFSGQNAGVTFTVLNSGQIQYTSTNIAGANYVGTLKYAIRKTFGV
jgi:hypothetical protein